jgi:hypothetical protein
MKKLSKDIYYLNILKFVFALLDLVALRFNCILKKFTFIHIYIVIHIFYYFE